MKVSDQLNASTACILPNKRAADTDRTAGYKGPGICVNITAKRNALNPAQKTNPSQTLLTDILTQTIYCRESSQTLRSKNHN